ncbi:MAG TPA: cytochrome c [Candidatus Lustribacter sp.]|nr:cytochrome c [Candidatus Lustribacter sp.]
MNIATRFVSGALVLTAALLLAAHGASAQGTPAAPAAAATAPPGDVARGKGDFMSYGCYECHGTVGQGNFGAGARIAPNPPPWATVSSYVRRPRGDMPSFSLKILSDATLADIYAYLKSIPAGKPGSQIPLLNSTTMTPK